MMIYTLCLTFIYRNSQGFFVLLLRVINEMLEGGAGGSGGPARVMVVLI